MSHRTTQLQVYFVDLGLLRGEVGTKYHEIFGFPSPRNQDRFYD